MRFVSHSLSAALAGCTLVLAAGLALGACDNTASVQDGDAGETCAAYCGAFWIQCPTSHPNCLADCQRLEGGACQAELEAHLGCLKGAIPKTSWECFDNPTGGCARDALDACAAEQGACDLATTSTATDVGLCEGSATCGTRTYEMRCSSSAGDPYCGISVGGEDIYSCPGIYPIHDPTGIAACDIQRPECKPPFPQMP